MTTTNYSRQRKELQQIRKACLLPSHDRTEQNIDAILGFVKDVKIFCNLDSRSQWELCRTSTLETYAPREYVCHLGEYGDKFYIVLTGSVVVLAPPAPNPSAAARQLKKSLQPGEESFASHVASREYEVVGRIECGWSFGEVALQDNQIRTATIQSSEFTELLVVTKENYDRHVGRGHKEITATRKRFLRICQVINPGSASGHTYSEQNLVSLANCLNDLSVQGRTVICRQGDIADKVIFLRQGKVSIMRAINMEEVYKKSSISKKRVQVQERHSSFLSSGHATSQSDNNDRQHMTNLMLPDDICVSRHKKRQSQLTFNQSPRKRASRVGSANAHRPSATSLNFQNAHRPQEGAHSATTSTFLNRSPRHRIPFKAREWTLDSLVEESESQVNTPRASSNHRRGSNRSSSCSSSSPRTPGRRYSFGTSRTRERDAMEPLSDKRGKLGIPGCDVDNSKRRSFAARKSVTLGAFRALGGGGGGLLGAEDNVSGAKKALPSEKNMRVVRIGGLQPYQYFGDQEALHGTPYPVSLLAHCGAELYLMSKNDMLRRLPKKLLVAFFCQTGQLQKFPTDEMSWNLSRQHKRWRKFSQLLREDIVERKRETFRVNGLPAFSRGSAQKRISKTVDIEANMKFLGLDPSLEKKKYPATPRPKEVSLPNQNNNTNVFSSAHARPLSVLTKRDLAYYSTQSAHKLGRMQELRKCLHIDEDSDTEEKKDKEGNLYDFQTEQHWNKMSAGFTQKLTKMLMEGDEEEVEEDAPNNMDHDDAYQSDSSDDDDESLDESDVGPARRLGSKRSSSILPQNSRRSSDERRRISIGDILRREKLKKRVTSSFAHSFTSPNLDDLAEDDDDEEEKNRLMPPRKTKIRFELPQINELSHNDGSFNTDQV